jgi:phosphatidylglycerophosphate synthase
MMTMMCRKADGFSMFDRLALKISKPVVDAVARRIHAAGYTAEQLTIMGLGFGLSAATLIAFGFTNLAVWPLLINRGLDGLDGAVARMTTSTDRGAFLDISFDFVFYASIPLAFATVDPVASAVLLAAFVGTGTSFLAYAIIAEKRGEKSDTYPSKSFYYLGGLTEGTETVLCFLLMCLWPQHFAAFAYVYATLCAVTTVTRLQAGWQRFAVQK